MAEIRRHIHFYGRVQGVGFRYKAKYMAQSLGLTGWVRNEWDGTVSMELQGSSILIDKLLEGLNNDRYISIDWMDAKEISIVEERGFCVR
ncbi:MAG: acylphosphatase [Lachnospiraceae bacterium]|nr:acylphosphatase [Lachnospiraceae bacterium]